MSELLENRMEQFEQTCEDSSEFHLLDLLIVLARNKTIVIGMPIAAGAVAMAISLMMVPVFTSTAKIMPPQQQGSGLASTMLGQLGGLASAAGSIAGLKNPNDLYVGMLESRTVADNLISRFHLKERYESKTMDEARSALDGATDINNGKKDGMISISVSDEDPKFAAELTNAYVDELTKLTQNMAVSDASVRRLFFEKQLKDAKDQLADAEVALRRTQEKTGMIQPEGQVQAIISSIAQLKATIASKEVELKAMRTFATAQNPELLRTQEELHALKAQLDKLEKNQPTKEGDFMVSSGKLPEVGVEYVRSLREVKYHEALFEMLAKQYELARIDEAKDSSVIQLLDKAIPAERKSKPKRALITMAGFAAGGVLGMLLAFLREAYTRSRRDMETKKRWVELKLAWKTSSRTLRSR